MTDDQVQLGDLEQFRDLLLRMKEGDDEAATQLVVYYSPKMRRAVRRKLGSLPALAAKFESMDFVQLAFASFVRTLNRLDFENEQAAGAYLSRVVMGKIVDMVRYQTSVKRGKHHEQGIGHEAYGIASVDPTAEHLLSVQESWKAELARHDDFGQNVLRLRADGFTIDEISTELGCHERTVRRFFDKFYPDRAR